MIPEDLLNQRLREIPPGCDGLVLQPYWGAGIKNPEARGAIIGVFRRTLPYPPLSGHHRGPLHLHCGAG